MRHQRRRRPRSRRYRPEWVIVGERRWLPQVGPGDRGDRDRQRPQAVARRRGRLTRAPDAAQPIRLRRDGELRRDCAGF